MNRTLRAVLTLFVFLGLLLTGISNGHTQEFQALYLHSVQPLPHVWLSSDGGGSASTIESLLAHTFTRLESLLEENRQPLVVRDANGWMQIKAPKGNTGRSLITLYGYVTGESYSKASLVWSASTSASILLDGQVISKQTALETAKSGIGTSTTDKQNTSKESGQSQKNEKKFLAEEKAELKLLPGAHLLQINLIVEGEQPARLRLCVEHPTASLTFHPQERVGSNTQPFRPLDLTFMMQTPNLYRVSPSPNGNYVIIGLRTGYGSRTGTQMMLLDGQGRVLQQDNPLLAQALWHPTEDAFYYPKGSGKQRQLWRHDLSEKESDQLILENLPEGSLTLAPMGDVLFVQENEKAPAKDALAIRFRDPDDRMPGWRDRQQTSIISLRTGVRTPLTQSKKSIRLVNIRPQGQKVLLATDSTNWTKQPFRFSTIVEYDYTSGQADTLFSLQADIVSICYIPNNERQLLVIASPNAFDGIGRKLPTGELANSFEHELFVYDRTTRSARCLTTDFNPSIAQLVHDYERGFYILADDKNGKSLHYLDNATLTISPLRGIETPTVKQIGCNRKSLWYIGVDPTHADRLYIHPHRGKKSQLALDLDAQKMSAGYIRPDYHAWSFTASDGTVIDSWYYLPPYFDPNRSYPLLVYYYGGTLPTTLGMEGTYSLPMYAAQGYVVLTLNPSGTIGYGQEFAARHLNAWGEPMAQEILGATRRFCQEHPFVNPQRIGCMGASYGGFMTQYLQTVDTLFAAAVSHAGISNITNYWGSGYWGIGYNSIAASGSYPWTRKDLFVERSPLFNAHKIHTPLLLLHGDSDTNVPTAESTNLYNALKVLGREVEMIHFTGQDHFIAEPQRRIRWTHAIMAWFQRWLKDDPTWWNDLPE